MSAARGAAPAVAGDSEVFTVTRWTRMGENSASGSSVEVVGFRAASAIGRRWLKRGPDCYFSIERGGRQAPFVAKRFDHLQGPDFLCMTGGLDDFHKNGGPLDAPEYIAAGSCYRSDGGRVWPSINGRGRWL